MKDSQSIIIIGAGRSGTNMLRDALVSLPGCGTWPCDEINYIWRHGNRGYPHDEIPAELAQPIAAPFIRRSFEKMTAAQNCTYLIEKTCANTLRVPFVDAVLPQAKYIYIERDGADVVASAMKRWGARLDIKYIMKKARYVPIEDIPYYGIRYASHRFKKLLLNDGVLPSWGPVYDGMRADIQCLSLAEVCALQWLNCVEKSKRAFSSINNDRVFSIRYEEFVREPAEKMKDICDFLGVDANADAVIASVTGITDRSVGAGKSEMLHREDAMNILNRFNK